MSDVLVASNFESAFRTVCFFYNCMLCGLYSILINMSFRFYNWNEKYKYLSEIEMFLLEQKYLKYLSYLNSRWRY